MNLVFEFVETLIYFGCVISIGDLFLGYAKRRVMHREIKVILLAVITSVIMLYANAGIGGLSHFFSVIILINIFFDEKVKTKLGLYVGTGLVLSAFSMLINIVLNETKIVTVLDEGDKILRIMNLLLIFLCICVIGKYYKGKYHDGLKRIGTRYWLVFILILFFDSIVIGVLGRFVLDIIRVERQNILIFSYWCVVIGIFAQLGLLLNTLVTRNIHKENELQAKYFLENQKEHYLHLEKRELETKKFRHDIRNHLTLLNKLIYNKEYDEVEKYLDELNEKVDSFGNKISVNNGIADAVLNKFYLDAKEQGIEITVNGHFPMECYITSYDICTILSNLMSNAIQADGKEVLVNIKYIDNKLLITIENDYVHELHEVDGVFKTTKEDSLGHGYGLTNVKECVEKKGGFLTISTENNRFKVMVMMINEEEML